MANVGLFFSIHDPAIVPDVLLSIDVRCGDLKLKAFRAYFPWEYGKAPDAVFEIVSNKEGEELGSKLVSYARLRIPYYIVWDPSKHLSGQMLHCFEFISGRYSEAGPWFETIGLGVTTWNGDFETRDDLWLRWCERDGTLLATGPEAATRLTARAEQEKARAEQEKARADEANTRAEKLAAQLRAAGLEPKE